MPTLMPRPAGPPALPMHDPTGATPLRFGRFELQLHERRLLVDGRPAPLGGRAFDLLAVLASRAGHLWSKRELIERVWPGRVVEENNLAAQVAALRKVLGPDLIASVAGRGYRLVAQLDAAPPAPGRQPALRTQLPASLPPLFGREPEWSELESALERHRVVSLVGAGGIGKSLLARHVLAARREAYAHGVCWVELAALTRPQDLPVAVAAALGVPLAGADDLQALAAALAPLELLIALDNAEQCLAGVAGFCQVLHDQAPGLRLLVTSQAALRIRAEQVLRLGALPVPDASMPAADARRHGALALFAERAQAVDPGFVLRDADLAVVAALCRRLDGVPLAIELAAARAPLVGLARLAEALDDRLAALSRNRHRDAAPRQQSLRAALEWSHALLGTGEQQVFRRLAVVAGGIRVELAQALLAADGAPPGPDRWGVIDAIDTLVERSLLALEHDADGTPRLRWLESPHALAVERLAEAGEGQAMARAHAAACVALAEQAYHRAFDGSTGVDDWERRLEPELDHLRQAWAWCGTAGDATGAAVLAATMLRALPAWRHAERMQMAEAAAPLAEQDLPPLLAARLAIELACALADTQKHRSLAAAMRALAGVDATIEGGEAGDDAWRFMRVHALSRAASAAAQAGEARRAAAWLAEAQASCDLRWPAQRRVWPLEAALVLARLHGDNAAALQRCRELLAVDRERGRDGVILLGNLVDLELAAGDAHAAERSGAALVEQLRHGRDEVNLAYARLNLCAARLALDDAAGAAPVAAAAWPQAVGCDLAHAAACYLALMAALQGRARAAAQLAGWADARYAERGEVREINETRALERVDTLAAAALGAEGFRQAKAEGAALAVADIAGIAFAPPERQRS